MKTVLAKSELPEDIKIYRDKQSKCLLFTRAFLAIVFIIMFLLGKKTYELLLIDAVSYLVENILNYKKLRNKEYLIAVVALVILVIALSVLVISKYV